MNNDKQLMEIAKYFKSHEKNTSDFKIGVEMEHLVLHKDTLTAVSYYEKDGIEDILNSMLTSGWQGVYEGSHLLGLHKDGNNITLEPGGQLEISIKPLQKISDIKKEYLDFLDQVIPILEANNQVLMSVGYHPETKISDIQFIPKQRYSYMSNYLKRRGKYALNMMKGTAAMHVNIDYQSETDYIKKVQTANCLSSVIAAMFDNSPYFEGERSIEHAIRTTIWQNCDDNRCGIAKMPTENEFGYNQYANYILNTPPIVINKGNRLHAEERKFKELFNPDSYTTEELEYMLTMVFPDVRTKGYIEVRMFDSVPYPLNMAGAALVKGLLYNDENLNKLYQYFADIRDEDIINAKLQVIQGGYSAKLKDHSIYDLARYIVRLAKEGLELEEKNLLLPLEKLVQIKTCPAEVTKEMMFMGKQQALQWCVLNNMSEGELNGFPYDNEGICQTCDKGTSAILQQLP
ncbi:MAG: glutamate--cysteine ligase [Firmicutes bacterium]|nr:glutamate--cysteine ligase [Bacillota bacterium]